MDDDGIDRALAQRPPGEIDARNPRMGGERHNPRIGANVGRAQAIAAHRQSDDGTALRRFIRKRREHHRFGKGVLRYARDRDELIRHAIAEGDSAGLVEQQRIDVARRLDRAAGSGDHVEADQSIHAGDADRRQQAADRRRNEADEQRNEHGHRKNGSRITGERPQRHADDQKDDGEARQQDRQREFIRRFLTLRAFH